jgi:UDPglucose 6-dehydrogenase
VNIAIIGAGYVGLSAGVGLASKGNRVICVDVDERKVNEINAARPPIYEASLEKLLKKTLEDELFEATTDLKKATDVSDIVFIAVATPSKKDGSTDMKFVDQATEDLGKALRNRKGYVTVVVKSTVPPKTTENMIIPSLEKNSGKKAGGDLGVCVNPEFMREGKALSDFLKPHRIIIGELDKKSGDTLAAVYEGFECPILRVRLSTAEMIKYASNAFLATKISFINEIGNICKKFGIDVYEVAGGMGLDKRIGPEFLRAGVGYGGSCLPKDVAALVAESERLGYTPELLQACAKVNEAQPLWLIDLLKKQVGGLKGKKIGILGLAFKPETDDIRGAPSIKIVEELLQAGAQVKAHDPKATENFKKLFPNIKYCDAVDVLNSDATLILTEWKEYENLDYSGKIVIDGRRVEKARNAKIYEGICW